MINNSNGQAIQLDLITRVSFTNQTNRNCQLFSQAADVRTGTRSTFYTFFFTIHLVMILAIEQ